MNFKSLDQRILFLSLAPSTHTKKINICICNFLLTFYLFGDIFNSILAGKRRSFSHNLGELIILIVLTILL